jgi:hypothetical protein
MKPRRAPVAVVVAIAVSALGALTGCAATVDLHPAPPHANDPHCADVMVRLPDSITGQTGTLARRETDAQSTAVWGDPTAVVLSCGVPVPGATTLPCFYYDDSVYWLRQKDDAEKLWRFTTFGRTPALQLTVSTKLSPGPVLDQLNGDVDFLPKNGHVCSSTDDTVTGDDLPPAGGSPSPTPTPTPTPTR